MTDFDQPDDLDRLTALWRNEETNEAGRLMYQRVPDGDRPAWAARALRVVIDHSEVDATPFRRLLRATGHPRKWRKALAEYDKIDTETEDLYEECAAGLDERQQVYAWILSLAELVVKVTHNATSPEEEFDEESGWWIAVHLRWFIEHWDDKAFSRMAWDTLCDSVS